MEKTAPLDPFYSLILTQYTIVSICKNIGIDLIRMNIVCFIYRFLNHYYHLSQMLFNPEAMLNLEQYSIGYQGTDPYF